MAGAFGQRPSSAADRRQRGSTARGRAGALGLAAVVVAGAVGCSTEPDPLTSPAPPTVSSGSPTAQATNTAPAAAFPAGPELPPATAVPQDVLTDLTTPWGLAFLPGGAALITSRDRGEVLLLTDTGAAALTGPGAEALAATTKHGGEGGLLGIAVSPEVERDGLVYLYRTTADGNEVVRAALSPSGSTAGSTDDTNPQLTLGELEPVLEGIPASGNHNGGRLAFGPDGYLYVSTGDAGDPDAAQDPTSLGGKILRLTPDGVPAPGNPTEGSPVWSLGHRNVQGLGWDPSGRMFASEFGQNTYDELNLIRPGGNYGWPVVEGRADAPGMVDPLVTWSTDVASPSGIAVTDAGVYLAALRGQRLWAVGFLGDGFADAGDSLEGELGRLRDVVQGPDGALWVLTQNTDGRGTPRPGDDRVVRLTPP